MHDFEKPRLDSITDGIYAVALTLLVLELKLPNPAAVTSSDELTRQILANLPKLESWLISFAVLSLFWYNFHRLMHRVGKVDATLLFWVFFHLALVAIAPFAVAVFGAYAMLLPAQIMYSGLMTLFSLSTFAIGQHLYRHQELLHAPLTGARFAALSVRTAGVVIASLAASLIAWAGSSHGDYAYLLIFGSGRLSGWVERRGQARAAVQTQPS